LEPFLQKLKSKGWKNADTVSDLQKLILEWYDGYSWDGKTRVLNPWAILNAFKQCDFADYWSQTGGVPSFLVNLAKSGLFNFQAFNAEESISKSLNTIEIGKGMKPIPVLFQSGYLTVDRVDDSEDGAEFFLKIPNLEVRAGRIPLLLSLDPIEQPLDSWKKTQSMLDSLNKRDAVGFQNAFGSFLADFPYHVHIPQEAYYHSLFQAAMILAGAKIESEVAVGDGRFDTRYWAPDGTLFVIELKHLKLGNLKDPAKMREKEKETLDAAMKQIEKKQYTKPYRGDGYDIYKVALVVSGQTDVYIEFKKESSTR
jgi:hypothetical protein